MIYKFVRAFSLCIALLGSATISLPVLSETLDAQALALLQNGETDKAADLIQSALDEDGENASYHYAAAVIYGEQAQNANVFSAMGLAKKTLKSYKDAVQFGPNNAEYRIGLMKFYIHAPGIVGGDLELGSAQAKEIVKLDPVLGFIATADLLTAKDDKNALAAHYHEVDRSFPDNLKILLRRGFYYQEIGKYNFAFQDFSKITASNPSGDDSLLIHHANYQLGRTSVLSKQNLKAGANALVSFLDKAPNDPELPPRSWAKYRLAMLEADMGNSERAKQLIAEAKTEAKDKQLQKKLKKLSKKIKSSK